MRVTSSVYMTLKIVVHVGDWQPEQEFKQLHAAATREAKEKLDGLFKGKGISLSQEPAIMHVITREVE